MAPEIQLEDDDLLNFLDSLPERTLYALQAQATPWVLEPRGASAPHRTTTSEDPAAALIHDQLVDAVKPLQKSSRSAYETWHYYCGTTLGGTRDPSRHHEADLHYFVDNRQQIQTQALAPPRTPHGTVVSRKERTRSPRRRTPLEADSSHRLPSHPFGQVWPSFDEVPLEFEFRDLYPAAFDVALSRAKQRAKNPDTVTQPTDEQLRHAIRELRPRGSGAFCFVASPSPYVSSPQVPPGAASLHNKSRKRSLGQAPMLCPCHRKTHHALFHISFRFMPTAFTP